MIRNTAKPNIWRKTPILDDPLLLSALSKRFTAAVFCQIFLYDPFLNACFCHQHICAGRRHWQKEPNLPIGDRYYRRL